MGVAHWDELEFHRRAKGEMDAEWQWLGHAAGTRGVGVIGRIETLDYGDGEPLEDD
jgi:hypothetical protein